VQQNSTLNMAKALVIAVLVGVLVAVAAGANVPSSSSRATYLGYNATYCRGLNFTLPVPGNCSGFYQCQNNNVWLNYCQYPLLYNHLNGFCDHPWNVRCNRTSALSRSGKDASKSLIPRPPVNQCLPHMMVNCFVDPCMMANCPAHPQAVCYADYCRGCSARFFTSNNDLSFTEIPRTSCLQAASVPQKAPAQRILYPPVNQCHGNMVACFVAPCQVAPQCNVEGAQCFDDYCGGCNARFFKINTWQTERPLYEEVCK